MPGILNRMACGVALALAIGGRASAADPPGGKKRLFFEECSTCIKHRKYRQKWPLGGAGLGVSGGMAKMAPQGGLRIFCDFCIFESNQIFNPKKVHV